MVPSPSSASEGSRLAGVAQTGQKCGRSEGQFLTLATARAGQQQAPTGCNRLRQVLEKWKERLSGQTGVPSSELELLGQEATMNASFL